MKNKKTEEKNLSVHISSKNGGKKDKRGKYNHTGISRGITYPSLREYGPGIGL